MKRRDPLRIDDIIDRALQASNTQTSFNEQKVCYLWPEIVGPGINRYTTRRFVDSGTLHVYLSSASLKNELQYMRSHLIAELNKAVGANVINSIVIH